LHAWEPSKYKDSAGKSEGKRPLRRPASKWEVDHKEIVWLFIWLGLLDGLALVNTVINLWASLSFPNTQLYVVRQGYNLTEEILNRSLNYCGSLSIMSVNF
jgi:hypothetical protein